MAEKLVPRLCYILPSYDPATGSHFFHLYELLERAAKDLDIFLIIEKFSSCPSGLPFNNYCQKFSFAPLRIAELFFILARERITGRKYFYTHYSFFGALASWLVTKIFGGTAYYWNCGMPWLYRRSFFEESVFRFALSHTMLVTGTAGLAAEYSRNYGLDKRFIRILPNWINLDRFANAKNRGYIRKKLGISTDQKIVLFVHHLSKRKGAHFVAPVAKSVTEQFKNVIFLIVGAGPESENLQLITNNLQLTDRVRLIGEVPSNKIQDYFALADVFFMPSEEEGFPHVLLEAMAAGVPYAASDVGGVKEITPPMLQNYIVRSGDVDEFSAKIAALLTKPAPDIILISEEEKEWVKKYDISEALPKFTALFTESLNSNL